MEAEALSTIGDVHRFTLNPKDNPWCSTTHAVDLMEVTPAGKFDLWFGHPMCTKYSDMPGVDPDDHIDQIPRARELAEKMADHYVIENKPRAPLEAPTHLKGEMFNLPIAYERAFETSFELRQPPRQVTFGSESSQTSPFFYSERSHLWWKTVKGIRGDYPKEHVAKNALPLAYVDYITRNYLEHTGTSKGVRNYSNYDDEMDERRARLSNRTLSEFK
ncbi:hypothetical protein G3A49_08050 [Haloferax volcanii]|uniref:Uncharacterized protein n=1 Tax=Haloferax volcanii TaxID=2246 RepID=A0A6C0USC7_HALVO|nr:hypothetical protein [Haloferax alexandrinus]QIB78090.1 hypothetical protein G3A49_08050 [Haloferax alexandrinus]